MPRGGKRLNAGRKPGAVTRKTREVADAAAKLGQNLPLQHLLSVLADPDASAARKDRAAEAACPYLHPRLNAVAALNLPNVAGGAPARRVEVRLYSIPRGVFLTPAQVADLSLLDAHAVPYEPAALTDQSAAPEAAPAPPEPTMLELEAEEAEPIVRLDSWRRKRGVDDSEPA